MITEIYPGQDEFSYTPDSPIYWYSDIGSIPLRVDSRLDGMDAQVRQLARTVHEFHCRMFEMDKEQDRHDYEVIKQRMVQGWYTPVKELTKWDEANLPLKVWLEWTQSYKEVPNGKH